MEMYEKLCSYEFNLNILEPQCHSFFVLRRHMYSFTLTVTATHCVSVWFNFSNQMLKQILECVKYWSLYNIDVD